MFSLSIALGNTSWRLLFKTEEKALAAYELIGNPIIENLIIADDFGQTATCKVANVHGFLIEDMDKTQLAHVELALYQARGNVRAQNAAQTDPTLKAARFAQSPSMISQMGNGMMPRN